MAPKEVGMVGVETLGVGRVGVELEKRVDVVDVFRMERAGPGLFNQVDKHDLVAIGSHAQVGASDVHLADLVVLEEGLDHGFKGFDLGMLGVVGDKVLNDHAQASLWIKKDAFDTGEECAGTVVIFVFVFAQQQGACKAVEHSGVDVGAQEKVAARHGVFGLVFDQAFGGMIVVLFGAGQHGELGQDFVEQHALSIGQLNHGLVVVVVVV